MQGKINKMEWKMSPDVRRLPDGVDARSKDIAFKHVVSIRKQALPRWQAGRHGTSSHQRHTKGNGKH
jgi:hypothetical protein